MIKLNTSLLVFSLLVSITPHSSAFEQSVLIGTWDHDVSMGREHIRFYEDNQFYAETLTQGKKTSARLGAWKFENDALSLSQTHTIRLGVGTEYSKTAKSKESILNLQSAEKEKLVLTGKDIFDDPIEVTFTRLKNDLNSSAPSALDLKIAQAKTIIQLCEESFNNYRFIDSLPTCLLGSTYKDAGSTLRLAALYKFGLGVNKNDGIADLTFRVARSIDPSINESLSRAIGLELDLLTTSDADSHLGFWCGFKELSSSGQELPSTTVLSLMSDGTFIYSDRATFKGEYTISDDNLDMGPGVGDYTLVQLNESEMVLNLSNLDLHFSRGRCPKPEGFNALLLENAIAANLVDLYNEILDQGHNVNALNKASVYENSPLLSAVKYGRTDLVARLLEAGADTTYSNFAEQTASDINKSHDSEKITLLLSQ